jgi:ABC-2 type transport system ATP-binding protein
MIELKNIWHHYGIRPTLRDINLTVAPGELLCVMGPNGMGKSTLLCVIAGTSDSSPINLPGLTR